MLRLASFAPTLRTVAVLLAASASLALACADKKRPEPAAVPSAVPSALPVDHLAPGELAPGKTEVHGFPVPRGMSIESRLLDRVYLRGRVSPEGLANYVRQHVTVSHVEVAAARTVFPQARIKAGPKDRVFNLEVLPDRNGTRLAIVDVTPPPPPPPGLSDAERWRAAGRTPDGKPLDMKKLE
jgi:hypothetical protein